MLETSRPEDEKETGQFFGGVWVGGGGQGQLKSGSPQSVWVPARKEWGDRD